MPDRMCSRFGRGWPLVPAAGALGHDPRNTKLRRVVWCLGVLWMAIAAPTAMAEGSTSTSSVSKDASAVTATVSPTAVPLPVSAELRQATPASDSRPALDPKLEEPAPSKQKPSRPEDSALELSAQRFSLQHAHIWRGQQVPIVVEQPEVSSDGALRIHKVFLIDASPQSRRGVALPGPATRPAEPLDLSQASTLSPDRRTLQVQLPRSTQTGPLAWTMLDTLRQGQAKAVLCIYYSEPDGTASPQGALCPGSPEGLLVAALPVRVSQRGSAALWGGGGLLITLLLLHWVLLTYWGKGQQTVLGQHQSALWLPKRVLLSMMSLTLTPTGSFSLSMAQILWWTLITGFGLTYVWAMTEQFLAITDQVLMLMGIGSTTAIISRVTSNNRTFLPDRYLGLVQARERLPRLSDLVTIDGKPSIFKFQMLLFTALSGIMVLQGLITRCAFPALPGELVTLMGISSATYVGNELAQRDIWEQIQEKVKAIEAFARQQHLPLVSRRDVLRLKEQTEISAAVEELESLLKQVFGDDPGMQTQSFSLPPTAEKASSGARPASAANTTGAVGSAPEGDVIPEGDRRDPA